MSKISVKLTITPSEVVKILKNHEKCVGSKIMPITENVLLVIEPDTMQFVTTDSSNFVKTTIPVTTGKEAIVLVPFKKLMDLMKLLSEQPINLTCHTEDYKIKIKADEGTYEIAGENPEDFPAFPDDEKKEWFSASGPAFKAALENVLYAVAKDDVRPAMCGVLIESNGKVEMTATDGNVLAHSEVVEDFIVHNAHNEIVRAEILESVLKIIPDEKTVEVLSNERNQWFQIGDVVLCTRKIDEKYPNWRGVLPNYENSFKIDKKNWLLAVNRMLLFTDSVTRVIKTEINLKSISISADSHNWGHHGHERVALESDATNILTIGHNASQIKEALAHITQEVVTVEFSQPSKAIVINHESGFALIMPIVLNNVIQD